MTPNAKLLYGEITALCNERGYCWASNQYFAELYNTTTRNIARWVSSLVERGYLESSLQYKAGTKEVESRILSLPPYDKNVMTPGQNCHAPHDKNVIENNTVSNNTSNNTTNKGEKRKRFAPPTVDDVRSYCLERENGIDPQSFVDYYTARNWYIGKTKMSDWKAAVRTWENRRKADKPQKAAPDDYGSPLDFYK